MQQKPVLIAMPDLGGMNMLDLHQSELSCCNPAVAQRALGCFLQVLPSLQANHGRMDTWMHGRMDTCADHTSVSKSEDAHSTASVLLHIDKHEGAVEHFTAAMLGQAAATHS